MTVAQTETTETNDSARFTKLGSWSILAMGAAMSLGALLFAGWRAGYSVALGAGFGAGNLWALGRIVGGLVDPNRPKAPWIVLGVLKWSGVLGLLYVLIRTGFADILPLALGLATLPLGILVAQLAVTHPPRRQS